MIIHHPHITFLASYWTSRAGWIWGRAVCRHFLSSLNVNLPPSFNLNPHTAFPLLCSSARPAGTDTDWDEWRGSIGPNLWRIVTPPHPSNRAASDNQSCTAVTWRQAESKTMGDFTGENKTKRWIEGLEKRGWREELVPCGYEVSQQLGLKPSVHCEWTGATWENTVA